MRGRATAIIVLVLTVALGSATTTVTAARASATTPPPECVGLPATNPPTIGPLDQGSRVRAAGAWSGPTNYTDTSLLPTPPTLAAVELAVVASVYVGCSIFPGPEQSACLAGRARDASPVFGVDAGDPPMLLATGDPDLVVPQEQTTQLAQALTSAGVSNQVVLAGALCHAEGCDRIAWDPTLQFFLSELAAAPAPTPIPTPTPVPAALVITPAFTG